MKISVTGRQFEITPSIREYVESRIQALVEDKALDFSSAKVVMDYQKNSFITTLVVNCKYHVVPAEVEDFDLYKSFDACVAKVDTQLKTIREKIRSHQAPPLREVAEVEEEAVEE